ncbi:MAG: hypothetical protein ACTSRG_19655 [Candidatus Helarchaeota archaeon]
MSEVKTDNNWWKLEDSWRTISKVLPWVFMPFIGVAILLIPIFLILIGPSHELFYVNTILIILSLIVVIVGFVPYFVILANQIGNAVKIYKVKDTLPSVSDYKKIFAYYLVGLLAPIVGPLFWSKAINNIMKYLGTQIPIQQDIEYVKDRGKIYGILGMILWVSYFVSYIYLNIIRFLSLMGKIVITRGFSDFLILFFSILAGIMLVLGIIMVAIQIGIINRLIESIHKSGLY